MATTTPKVLAEGQLAAAKATIYTVPAGLQAIIRNVAFGNIGGVTENLNLYVKKSGSTSRLFSKAQLDMDEFAHEEDIGTLDAGDELEAETTNATSVDFSVHGVEVAP
jgi:hypothetical protein